MILPKISEVTVPYIYLFHYLSGRPLAFSRFIADLFLPVLLDDVTKPIFMLFAVEPIILYIF